MRTTQNAPRADASVSPQGALTGPDPFAEGVAFAEREVAKLLTGRPDQRAEVELFFKMVKKDPRLKSAPHARLGLFGL